MALQNRVTPLGEIISVNARGTLMGNRGGRFHRDDRTLGRSRWKSKAWIACRLSFNDRHRAVMGRGYTELFFLDEATALAAGHRPCFECRRSDAIAFRSAFAAGAGLSAAPRAAEMDAVLHAERCAVRGLAALPRIDPLDLPDGTMVATRSGAEPAAWLLFGPHAFEWSPSGYGPPRRRGDLRDTILITPPAMVGALRAGFVPALHPSALADRSAAP